MSNAESSVGIRSSWAQNVDPVTKLLLIACVLLGSLLYKSLSYSLIVLGLSVMLVVAARIGRKALKLIAFSLLLIATIVVIQGLLYPLNQTVAVTIFGLHFYREGLLYALMLSSRLLSIIFVTSFFIFTTTIGENTHYLEQIGVPYHTVYVLISVCYILPQINQNMHHIQVAQRARGVNPQSNVAQRVRAIVPILVPLITKTLMQSVERSTALQLRGFNNPHRKLTGELTYYQAENAHRGLILLAVLIIGWKIWTIISKLI
ncbi:energy-coupling factor transporter transmembrane component T [Lacticaseibacillus zhaodongensis]|uniref:energy-coupling factor transporter transmembrane component T n=1 Tax=Lacticaseibacillus zhaodongensis TaxID=2668065 RepID=UPI0012D3620D|nr:energy-coupling factor transporter transmembrane component T [Lacticaseibacillus zhaodongensis]